MFKRLRKWINIRFFNPVWIKTWYYEDGTEIIILLGDIEVRVQAIVIPGEDTALLRIVSPDAQELNHTFRFVNEEEIPGAKVLH